MLAHRFELGDLSGLTAEQRDAVHDTLMEQVANGGVLAMRAYLELVFEPGEAPALDTLDVGYRLPEGHLWDASCQVTPIGPAFFDECRVRGAVTCFEAAIYHAAWEQTQGREAWVAIKRPVGIGHAVVWYPNEGQFFDAANQMLKKPS